MRHTIVRVILISGTIILLSACSDEAVLEIVSASNEVVLSEDDYWTQERMQNAVEMSLPEISEEDISNFKYYSPKDQNQKLIEPSTVSDLNAANIDLIANGKVTEADVGKRPFWNAGKLFFTTPNGDSTCTAQFVGSGRVIMTAAHCVVDGDTGKWYKNFRFQRAYNSGGGQTVGWECGSVYKSWYTPTKTNYPYDYAFLYMSSKSGAGWMGFKTGTPYNDWTSVGYPKNFHCGSKMGVVNGSKGNIGTGVLEMLNNPMYKGASGGAWIGDLNSSSSTGNYAISLNSHTGTATSLWGPQFDTNTYNLLQHVKAKSCQ